MFISVSVLAVNNEYLILKGAGGHEHLANENTDGRAVASTQEPLKLIKVPTKNRNQAFRYTVSAPSKLSGAILKKIIGKLTPQSVRIVMARLKKSFPHLHFSIETKNNLRSLSVSGQGVKNSKWKKAHPTLPSEAEGVILDLIQYYKYGNQVPKAAPYHVTEPSSSRHPENTVISKPPPPKRNAFTKFLQYLKLKFPRWNKSQLDAAGLMYKNAKPITSTDFKQRGDTNPYFNSIPNTNYRNTPIAPNKPVTDPNKKTGRVKKLFQKTMVGFKNYSNIIKRR